MLRSKAKWTFQNTEKELSDKAILDQLFQERGLLTKEEQEQFLNPNLENIQAPINFFSIEKAKNRINEAINLNEKIVVYGDYDADGISATALLIKALEELGARCDYYIPNRFTEGYGLQQHALEQFHRKGVSLVITVDNGIANSIEADYAKHLAIDLIITDHHEVQTEIPDALAVLHTSLSPEYKFKHLAGVGVAFQLAHCLLGRLPKHLLELVAMG